MKKRLGQFGSLVILIPLVMVCVGCSKHPVATPSVAVRLLKPSIDMGSMQPTNRVSADWELVNESTSDVKLESLVLSCSCMTTDFEPTILAPGERKRFCTWVDDPAGGVTSLTGRLPIDGSLEVPEFKWRFEIKAAATIEPSLIHLANLWLDDVQSMQSRVIYVTQIDKLSKPEEIIQLEIEQTNREYAFNYEVQSIDTELFEGSRLRFDLKPRSDARLGAFEDKVVVGITTKNRQIRVQLLVIGNLYSSLQSTNAIVVVKPQESVDNQLKIRANPCIANNGV